MTENKAMKIRKYHEQLVLMKISMILIVEVIKLSRKKTIHYYELSFLIYSIKANIILHLRRVQDLNLRAKEKLGSPDFESGALPLCQLSATKDIIPY